VAEAKAVVHLLLGATPVTLHKTHYFICTSQLTSLQEIVAFKRFHEYLPNTFCKLILRHKSFFMTREGGEDLANPLNKRESGFIYPPGVRGLLGTESKWMSNTFTAA
jgi:hypothetical protein